MIRQTTPAMLGRFDALCRRVKGRTGPGLTLTEISDCHALASELEAEEPDPGRVEMLAERLALEPEELTATTEER